MKYNIGSACLSIQRSLLLVENYCPGPLEPKAMALNMWQKLQVALGWCLSLQGSSCPEIVVERGGQRTWGPPREQGGAYSPHY